MVHERLGQEQGNALVRAVLAEHNLESTTGMSTSTYTQVVARIMEILETCDDDGGDEQGPDQSGDPTE